MSLVAGSGSYRLASSLRRALDSTSSQQLSITMIYVAATIILRKRWQIYSTDREDRARERERERSSERERYGESECLYLCAFAYINASIYLSAVATKLISGGFFSFIMKPPRWSPSQPLWPGAYRGLLHIHCSQSTMEYIRDVRCSISRNILSHLSLLVHRCPVLEFRWWKFRILHVSERTQIVNEVCLLRAKGMQNWTTSTELNPLSESTPIAKSQ